MGSRKKDSLLCKCPFCTGEKQMIDFVYQELNTDLRKPNRHGFYFIGIPDTVCPRHAAGIETLYRSEVNKKYKQSKLNF